LAGPEPVIGRGGVQKKTMTTSRTPARRRGTGEDFFPGRNKGRNAQKIKRMKIEEEVLFHNTRTESVPGDPGRV